MTRDHSETLLALLPDVPALQVAWVGVPLPALETIQEAIAPQGGEVALFGPKALAKIQQGPPRSFEALVLNSEAIAIDKALLKACFDRLENSAVAIIIGGAIDHALLESAGFSNPSVISDERGDLQVAHKCFAWGSL